MQINCLEPQFIVNPNLGELIGRFHHYFFHGQYFTDMTNFCPFFHFDKRKFNDYLKHINIDNYEDNFVIDKATGITYPIYLCVPCGHCVLCKEKKVNSFVNRIKYESFLYTDKPLFLTLTYSDKWLPSDGLSLRDVQLFFKRFRINLQRHGFHRPIRYCVVGEYGKRTHRAHYHAIIFGLPTSNDVDLRDIEALINKSWARGFTLSRAVDMSNNNTAYYTTKYLRKDCVIPDGCSDTFCTSSRRNGGLGSGFFNKQAETLRKRVTTNPKVINPWNGKVEDMMWSSYAIDKIYPSEKKFIPLKLRKALKGYAINKCIQHFENPELDWLYETNFQIIKDKFGSLVYFPIDLDNISHLASSVLCNSWNDLSTFEKQVLHFIESDFGYAKVAQKNREFFLSNLCLNQDDVDLAQKVARIRRRVKASEAREVL